MTRDSAEPAVWTVRGAEIPQLSLGDVGTQLVLLGRPRADSSPMLMGITMVRPGQTSPLIEHDTAEICYVLVGSGWIVTNRSEHPFAPGDAILIEARGWHAIRAGEDQVRMLYVFPTPDTPPTRTTGPRT